MSAGNFTPYKSFPFRVANGSLDYLTGTLKAALLDDIHTPDVNAHDTWDDVSVDECADPDYAQQVLSGKSVTQDGGNRTVFDADDVDFGNAVTISARYLVLYFDSGVPSTSYLMGYVDLNDGGSGNVSSIADDFDVGFNAAGIYRITP